MRKILLILLFLSVASLTVYAETLTLSTYYPAPFGAYDRLRLVPRDPPPCDPSLEGMMYYDQTERILKICQSNGLWEFLSGVWTQDASDNVFITDTPNPNLQVGIGTTTPSALLELQGPATGDGLYIRAGEVNGTDFILHLEDQDGSTQAMHVDASGDIGIGTTNPNERLDVNGNVIIGSGASAAGSTLGVFGNLSVGGGGGGGYAATAAPANGMIVRGNVGIGTTSPNERLDVNGDVIIGSGASAAGSTLGVFGNLSVGGGGGGGYAAAAAPANGMIVSGNVGIGTSTPSQRLDVTGQIHASGDICTDMGGGSCLSTGGGGGGHGDGANCPAGQAAGGVDANGNVQTCVSTSGGGHGDGSNCPANQASRGVDANGNAQGCTTIPSSALCTWDRTTYSTGAQCYVYVYRNDTRGYEPCVYRVAFIYDRYTCSSSGSWSAPQQRITCASTINSSFYCGR